MGLVMNITKEGYVAIQHYNTNGWSVKVGDTTYTWIPQHNVSMAWVKEEDVDKILKIRTRGCCGTDRNRFVRSSQIAINLWSTGNRHGETNSYM